MRRCLLLAALLLVSRLLVAPALAQQIVPPGGVPSRGPEIIPDQYIVELRPGESGDAVARGHGVAPLVRFGIINGFVARMSSAAATALSRDVRVLRDQLLANENWDEAAHAYAEEHDRSFQALLRIENWMTELLLTPGEEAAARRFRVLPRMSQEPQYAPDVPGLGPDGPNDEAAFRHLE